MAVKRPSAQSATGKQKAPEGKCSNFLETPEGYTLVSMLVLQLMKPEQYEYYWLLAFRINLETQSGVHSG